MPSLDLISFDLDGTLVDTADEIVTAALGTLSHFGLPRQETHTVVHLIGRGTRELMVSLLARVERDVPSLHVSIDAAMPVFDDLYAKTTGTTARPYEGCADMLAALRSDGLKIACVTNKEHRHAMRVLEATGIASHFHTVIGGDTLTHKKPHPDVLRTVAARLRVASTAQVAHVGDSAIDVQAARNAGAIAWAVPWGYNGGRPIAESNPDALFASMPAIVSAVRRLRGGGASPTAPHTNHAP